MHREAKLENLQAVLSMLKDVRGKTDAAGEQLLTYLIDVASAEADERARSLRSRAGDQLRVRSSAIPGKV